jgi:hypothetical protein
MQACFVDVFQRVFTTLMPRVLALSQLWCQPQAFGVVGRELRVIPKQLGHRFFMAFIFLISNDVQPSSRGEPVPT